MSKRFMVALTMVMITLVAIFSPVNALQVSASSQDVMYEVKEAGGGGISIADGYFVKPAKLTVENGKNYVQLTLKDADYVKSLSGPYGAAQVISDEGKKRVVKMQVGDITKPVDLQMHVVVPEEVAGMPYDHQHKALLVINTDGVDLASLGASDKGTETAGDSDKDDDNPKTSDTTPFMMYAVLLVGSIATMIVLWKRRPASE